MPLYKRKVATFSVILYLDVFITTPIFVSQKSGPIYSFLGVVCWRVVGVTKEFGVL